MEYTSMYIYFQWDYCVATDVYLHQAYDQHNTGHICDCKEYIRKTLQRKKGDKINHLLYLAPQVIPSTRMNLRPTD